MRLSYNLIKEDSIIDKEAKLIETEFIMPVEEEELNDSDSIENKGVTYEEAQSYIKNYENIGQSIIIEARKKGDAFLVDTIQKAQTIEKEAYEKGYKQGTQNGYEDGKKEALDTYIPQAEEEAKQIKEKAENILKNATKNYDDYLISKKSEILNLALSIAENILNREVKDKEGINNLVDSALELSKGEENVIIKCNPEHEEQLKKQIMIWKATYNIQGEIFILTDEEIPQGNATIEKSNGRVEVGVDVGLERIREALFG